MSRLSWRLQARPVVSGQPADDLIHLLPGAALPLRFAVSSRIYLRTASWRNTFSCSISSLRRLFQGSPLPDGISSKGLHLFPAAPPLCYHARCDLTQPGKQVSQGRADKVQDGVVHILPRRWRSPTGCTPRRRTPARPGAERSRSGCIGRNITGISTPSGTKITTLPSRLVTLTKLPVRR